MTIRTTLNVSLTVELGEFIQRQIRTGRYRTASELVRAALRRQQEHDEPPASQAREGSAVVVDQR